MGNRKSKSSKRKSSEVIRSKKSRKSKKKPSRRRHSISSCSDDDSVSSISFYSSRSDEDYRSRKSHSLSRADVKSKKKRPERRASSKRKKRAEKGVSSNQESNEDCKPSRKRKKSRSKKRTEHKERPQKKQRRDSSISSATSDSLSCSSCEYEHNSSNEVEFEHRSGKKIRDRRNPDVHKVEAKESGSKSANSLSTEDHSNFHNVSPMGEEPVADNLNNARRIRSVITVIEHPREEEDNLSKNNDAGNGARENTLAFHSDAVTITSDAVDKIIVNKGFDDVIGEPISRGKSVANQCINLGESEKVGGVSDSVVSINETTSGSEDLELILRQKALENLRKFRGKIQAVPIKYENVSNMLLKEEGSEAIKVTSAVGQSSNSGLSKEISKNVSRKDHVNSTPAINDKSKASEQASSNEAPLDGKERSGKNTTEMSNARNSAMAEPTCGIRTLEERSSNDQAEAKDGEQFQQKTMSVMRSGEMVQVSYKVYIPKRAPALSRRQLMQ